MEGKQNDGASCPYPALGFLCCLSPSSATGHLHVDQSLESNVIGFYFSITYSRLLTLRQ